ncbi:MAG: Rz1-like lysis system protein LysC [Ewingella americana]|uniref:Rz1-like lysis system protein LysC n=1 Tax=Ewingella americana TaxID=41202 RepID=UPI001E3581FC|nr:Rz1-like lysis system protein LysC [Ewingella americana]MCI1680048.1 Rz1-like lysis system protein LysC [Ewingella americana]MCI1855043.1 Rz1-like lysis system protein LysC [Ewingella americana]MCI1863520.1 Rz1-like lysis system protein LysC [Ewingella americana]MCI2143390.1 Rz1-like lysis system protein LysC [Ewingella americana]MCI2164547.1 Rz1-like lysis system protein LysC [Ewingella americana]
MTLSGCKNARPLPPPEIIYIGCPAVSSCPIPASHPKNNGDLSADVRNLEAALVACGLQIETVKQCQENHRAKTFAASGLLNGPRAGAQKKP